MSDSAGVSAAPARILRSVAQSRWGRYLVTGVAATASYFVLGWLFVGLLEWPLLTGNGCAYAISFFVSYFGQCFWTFGRKDGRHAVMLARFAAVQLGFGLCGNSAIVHVLDAMGLPYGACMFVAAALMPFLTYFLLRLWVFSADNAGDRPRWGGLPGFSDAAVPAPPRPEGHIPRISVIMNCLDCARDLPEALDSLAAQTFTDFEVIFWDNASSDDSPRIAAEHPALKGRLRLFREPFTVPLGVARNRALAEARGEFVAFLDCDDLWRPDKLARQLALFDDPAVGLACTDTEMFDGRRVLRRVFASAAPARGMAFDALVRRQWISMSSAMLRRSALDAAAADAADESGRPQAFDPRFNVCEEADLFYRVAHGWKLDYVDAPLTIWRVSGSSTTFRKFGQVADETLAILERHRRLYPGYDEEHADLADLLVRRAAFQKAVALWRDGRGAEARKVLAPWRSLSLKHCLFWWASRLPGSCFEPLARLYFALPRLLGR